MLMMLMIMRSLAKDEQTTSLYIYLNNYLT